MLNFADSTFAERTRKVMYWRQIHAQIRRQYNTFADRKRKVLYGLQIHFCDSDQPKRITLRVRSAKVLCCLRSWALICRQYSTLAISIVALLRALWMHGTT